MIEINEKGCPCRHNCCTEPKVIFSEHSCEENKFCEECYAQECLNCSTKCYCEL